MKARDIESMKAIDKWYEMIPNYQMIVERYPNRTQWLAVRFLDVKSSLYLSRNQPGGQAPHVFQKKKEKLWISL